MTDAGVSGEGTQSAKALPPSNPAMNSPTSQRLIMLIELPPATGWSPQRSRESSPQLIYVRVHQRQVAWNEAKGVTGENGSVLPKRKPHK